MNVADRIVVGCYGAVPASEAVAYLLDDGLPDVSPSSRPLPEVGGPGATPAPPPKPSFMTRCKLRIQRAKIEWGVNLPFPNPLQAVVLALGIGIAFLLGGTDRISAPTYGAVRTFGGDLLWGLAFLTVTVGLIVTWRWFHHGLFVAYVAAASAYLMFALAVARAAWTQNTVSWIAVVVFGWLWWVHSMAAKRVSGEWRVERWIRERRLGRNE